jgi:peroxiredoxin
MICPNCGYSEGNHIKKAQSDKEKYLEFWGFTPDTPEAEAAWKEKQEMTYRKAPMVISDIEGYVSQVDGSYIDSRSKHKAHLKQHRMIELGNDVPTQHRAVDVSSKSKEARKRQIAELAYAKLNYR